MPRDLNGNYTLPAGNPVVTGTVITSTWANNTMTDVGSELTDSLSRSGKGGFTAPVGIVDKSGSVPGLNFVSEPTSGFKREASEDIRMQVTTTEVWQGIKTGVKVLTPGSGGVLKHPVVEESGQKVLRGVAGTTVIWFYANTVPPGWTIEAPDTNLRNLSIAPGGAVPVGGGTIAGDIDPSAATLNVDVVNVTVDLPANTGGHTLVKAEVPNTGEVILSKDPLYLFSNASTPSPVLAYPITGTDTAGGGGVHSHSIGGVASQTVGTGIGSTADFNPRRALGVLGKLNA